EPGVKEHALQLAEKFPTLLPEVVKLKDDSYARVVMQTALSLGNFSSNQVVPALADIVQKYYKDAWIRMAVLSSIPGSSLELLKTLENNTGFFDSWDGDKQKFLHDFTYITAAHNDEKDLLSLVSEFGRIPRESQETIWKGLVGGLKRSKSTLSDPVKEKIAEVT